MLKPSLQRQVRKALEPMTTPVTLAVFTTADGDPHACEICEDTRQLAEEIAFLSNGKVTARTYDLVSDAALARSYRVEVAPAVVVLDAAGKDHGIRFFGIPTGYEFGTLVADINMVSNGDVGLRAETLDLLARLDAPLDIQVFVTPTCPYCPPAVHLAHRLAFASSRVTASMVDASEFPDLADRYHVHAVPLTVINDTVRLEGSVPEAEVEAKLRHLVAEAKTA
jgi:glutaredoxin-like protein